MLLSNLDPIVYYDSLACYLSFLAVVSTFNTTQGLSIICVGTLFILSMKFPIAFFTIYALKNTLFIIDDFSCPTPPQSN